MFYGFEVVTGHTHDQFAWDYGGGEFFEPVLDFLNKNYLSLAGGVIINGVSTPSEAERHIDMVIDDLSNLEQTAIREMVDMVLLSDSIPYNLSCEQKYSAYMMINLAKHRYLLDYSAEVRVETTGAEDYHAHTDRFRNSGKQKDFFTLCDVINENNYTPLLVTCHVFRSFCDMIRFLMSEMIRLNVSIKKCKNCGKYYVPSRSDALFCSGVSPQDEKKTCQEYGKYSNYLEKTRTDEATRLYKQIYNAKNNRARQGKKKYPPNGNPPWNTDLEGFIAKANAYKADIKGGIKSETEYIEWLKSMKEKKVFSNAT